MYLACVLIYYYYTGVDFNFSSMSSFSTTLQSSGSSELCFNLVDVLPDEMNELDETVVLTLSGSFGSSSTTIVIVDDDGMNRDMIFVFVESKTIIFFSWR